MVMGSINFGDFPGLDPDDFLKRCLQLTPNEARAVLKASMKKNRAARKLAIKRGAIDLQKRRIRKRNTGKA